MTEPALPDRPAAQSTGSLVGALLLGFLGLLFLLSTGCFSVFGIAFLMDGQTSALILVFFGICMGLLTFVTLRGAGRLYRGSPGPVAVTAPDAIAPDLVAPEVVASDAVVPATDGSNRQQP